MTTTAVFGAAAGIGWEIAKKLNLEGHTVNTFDVDDLPDLMTSGMHTFGKWPGRPYHEVFHNTGSEIYVTFGQPSARSFDNTDVNGESELLLRNFQSVTQVMRAVRKQGTSKDLSLVLTASCSGLGADPSGAIYAASKAAVISLTRSLAREWAPWRVNCVAPGPTSTDQFLYNVGISDQIAEKERSPHRRLIKPAEVADAMISLCRLTAVSGVCLPVDLAGSTSTRRL